MFLSALPYVILKLLLDSKKNKIKIKELSKKRFWLIRSSLSNNENQTKRKEKEKEKR